MIFGRCEWDICWSICVWCCFVKEVFCENIFECIGKMGFGLCIGKYLVDFVVELDVWCLCWMCWKVLLCVFFYGDCNVCNLSVSVLNGIFVVFIEKFVVFVGMLGVCISVWMICLFVWLLLYGLFVCDIFL